MKINESRAVENSSNHFEVDGWMDPDRKDSSQLFNLRDDDGENQVGDTISREDTITPCYGVSES